MKLRPVVSAVTQVTKATIYYKSENYTRKFNNAKTAGLCGDSGTKQQSFTNRSPGLDYWKR